MWQRGHYVGCVARLEAAGGDHLLSISHLDGEGVQAAPQDSVRAVVEWRQGWHVAILVHQHVGGIQEGLGKHSCRDLVGSCVKPTVHSFGATECCLHFSEKFV